MGLPNGIHHLAICTKDIKAQIKFYTEVVGMELEALYWMHGVENTFHGFLKLGDSSSIALVQNRQISEIEPQIGVSHPQWTGANVAPGTMQHVALNVDTEADLLAMRDRVRSHGYWVMGPLDHGFCKSIYLAAPEGVMLEFSTSEGNAIDAEAWIDPEVVELAGISADELEHFKHPQGFVSQGGRVAQPKPDSSRPRMVFPRGDAGIYKMPDAEITRTMSMPTPQLPPKAKSKAA